MDAPRVPPQAWSAPGWPTQGPGRLDEVELWCYTDQFSYRPGDRVEVRAHSTVDSFTLTVLRDGAEPAVVHLEPEVVAAPADTPHDAFAVGCGWPVVSTFNVGSDWRPGLYLLVLTAIDSAGKVHEREHFIVVRTAVDAVRPRLALLLTTCTLMAYNDWGGANHYRGLRDVPWVDIASPVVSMRRPLGRGFLRLPPDAPRQGHRHNPGPMEPPTYPSLDWARANGYSRHYADAFWATYERPFVIWAENAGYELDYLTQHDLHSDPDALDGISGVVIVGHDEYWTWEMRDAVDAFVDGGGHVARFAGNYTWQVRLSADGATQTCYKWADDDPYSCDPLRQERTSTRWEVAGRPAATTMGLTGLAGIYNRFGNAAPRSSGGFTVYRSDHWTLAGTGLTYGDLLGGPPAFISVFELDGVDYTFRDGLPYSTGTDGAPDNLEIIAMAPALLSEPDFWDATVPLNAAAEHRPLFQVGTGELIPQRAHGCGMVAYFERGAGSVFNTGSTEWVNGLTVGDEFVDRITRNVLDRAQSR